MTAVALLVFTTAMYADYNLFIKAAGTQVPPVATTTIAATICLQIAALSTSLLFLGLLAAKGG